MAAIIICAKAVMAVNKNVDAMSFGY